LTHHVAERQFPWFSFLKDLALNAIRFCNWQDLKHSFVYLPPFILYVREKILTDKLLDAYFILGSVVRNGNIVDNK
jgi:hypothetical protein